MYMMICKKPNDSKCENLVLFPFTIFLLRHHLGLVLNEK